ncbi:hypothetical protein pb186bvf_013267 [Paramecium bursaria]
MADRKQLLDLTVRPLFIFAYFAFLVISVVLLIWQYKRETSNIILMTSLFIDLNHSLSYLWVALVNPGVANKQNAETLPTTIDETNRYQNEKRRNQQWYCKTCKLIQLSHTHHCYDCDVCVLEMDHHCPWTGKCIGKGNIKQFYYFLASTLIFMVYNIIISITQIDDVRRK